MLLPAEQQRARSRLDKASRTAYDIGAGQVIRATERHQTPLSVMLPSDVSRSAARADLERAGIDGRAARVAIGAAEDQHARADLGQAAAAADLAGVGLGQGVGEDQDARVGHVALDRAVIGDAVAELQRAAAIVVAPV